MMNEAERCQQLIRGGAMFCNGMRCSAAQQGGTQRDSKWTTRSGL
ncbi:UNVERIFIED_ORG: hypothetical protein ABIB13_000316 [Arthrobacter sp. UYEF2]